MKCPEGAGREWVVEPLYGAMARVVRAPDTSIPERAHGAPSASYIYSERPPISSKYHYLIII